MHDKASTSQVVRYLNGAFARSTRHLGNANQKGTALYAAQCDFMYLLNEIERGPSYLAPKAIASANALIDKLAQRAG